MERLMKRTAAGSMLFTALFVWLEHQWPGGVAQTLAITAGTVAYHFTMRLCVGTVLNALLRNRVDYTRSWFRVGRREMGLYKALRIRKWKNKMPTYDSAAFDPARHTWDEIAQAMCQSELVHECNALLSFLPLILAAWFGAFWVFLVTSILSAGYDLLFVAMQRFNRPRVLRMFPMERVDIWVYMM